MPNDPDLSTSLSENVKVQDWVKADVGSPSRPIPGFVAVLDALGAKNYSREKWDEFLKARNDFEPFMNEFAEKELRINLGDLKRFIFNDTVILAYVRGQTRDDARVFCHVLRAFELWYFQKDIFFRGVFAVGDFFRLDERTNTVVGPVVTDAATWFERAEWIGIHATPHTTMFLDGLLYREPDKLDYVFVDYSVPLGDQKSMRLKAINWPKLMFLQNEQSRDKAKAAILSLFAKAPMPSGSEAKYFNAVAFYDYIAEMPKHFEGR